MPWADDLLAALPKKVTTYGNSDDCFIKMEETFSKVDDETVVIDRKVQLRHPIKYIRLEFEI